MIFTFSVFKRCNFPLFFFLQLKIVYKIIMKVFFVTISALNLKAREKIISTKNMIIKIEIYTLSTTLLVVQLLVWLWFVKKIKNNLLIIK